MNDHAKRRQPLPPRDTSRNDTEQGLFQKFIVTRTDGSSAPGGKHEHCEYFVLDVDHDPHAEAALEAYARRCSVTHPELAVDMQQRYSLPVDATLPPSDEDHVEVPILQSFDSQKPIGSLRLHLAAMPPTPDWCISIGYQVVQARPMASGRMEVTGYRLLAASITSDSDYAKVIERERKEASRPADHGDAVKRSRAHAVGIARDIADAFATQRSDGGSNSALLRQLADELLAEPELVRAIAAWHQATQRMIDGTPPGSPVESDRSISDRARSLLAQLEALGIRSVLSAHHEEWWRIHADHERLQRDVLQVLHDGLRARQRAADRLFRQAQSDAAIDALRDAEMPQAVPGRARDLAARLENYTRPTQMGGNWTVGMAVDFLREIADAWNRRPAAGMVLSQEKRPAVYATPALVEATALWAGATMGEGDGVSFTSEQWAKFVQCLGAEPPLEVLVSPNQAVPAGRVDRECAERGCPRSVVCTGGRCLKFDQSQPCGCREGECESKPDRECRMTREIREGGHQ